MPRRYRQGCGASNWGESDGWDRLHSRTIIYGGQLSGFRVPLAQEIHSGLTSATLLTLVATPAMLALPHQPYMRAIGRCACDPRRRRQNTWSPADSR